MENLERPAWPSAVRHCPCKQSWFLACAATVSALLPLTPGLSQQPESASASLQHSFGVRVIPSVCPCAGHPAPPFGFFPAHDVT